MNPTHFTPSAPGRIVTVGLPPAQYQAYLPAPLPPIFQPTWTLNRQLAEAERALGELAGLGSRLSNPHLLIGPFRRREAVLSSRIEGTLASLTDLVLHEATPKGVPEVRDVREVSNYVKALDYGLERLNQLPVSLRLIREIHEHLLEEVRGAHLTPGQFRTTQNWIGRPGSNLNEATYVPPPPDELMTALGDLERFIHQKDDLPLLVRLALIHYQFEAIHPFLDGNGRVGRLLITFLLCAHAVLPGPLLYISAYFESHRDQYYDGLLSVSTRGSWLEWIGFFLLAVAESGRDGVRRARQLLDLREAWRLRVQRARNADSLLKLVDEVFRWPAMTVAHVQTLLSTGHMTARLCLNKLVDAGVLRQVEGRKRNMVFVADDLLRIVE